jgi:hypothetical protein
MLPTVVLSATLTWFLPRIAGPLQAMGVSIAKYTTPPTRPVSDHNSIVSGQYIKEAVSSTTPRQTQPPYGS